jgi:L-amino acid N-acyltransferase YncA
MIKKVNLKDGTSVVIRPMALGDLDRSVAFFQTLTPQDRLYLRHDVTRRDEVQGRIQAMQEGRVKRLVAVAENRIIADAALELESANWKRHVGELRLIIANPYKRKGLGMLMARELYSSAVEAELEEIIVRMMRPQLAARNIFRKLGFQEVTLLADYVKDAEGHKQDLVLMRCDLEGLWQRLDHFIADRDWIQPD